MNQLGEQLSTAIRPLLALIFAVTACAAFFFTDKLNADQWIGLAVMVLSYYFATKTAEVAARRAPNRATDVIIEGNVTTVKK